MRHCVPTHTTLLLASRQTITGSAHLGFSTTIPRRHIDHREIVLLREHKNGLPRLFHSISFHLPSSVSIATASNMKKLGTISAATYIISFQNCTSGWLIISGCKTINPDVHGEMTKCQDRTSGGTARPSDPGVMDRLLQRCCLRRRRIHVDALPEKRFGFLPLL